MNVPNPAKYETTHYLPVGKPSWEFDVNAAGKCLIITIGLILLAAICFITSYHQAAAEASVAVKNVAEALSRTLRFMATTFSILSVISVMITLAASVYETPSIGGMKYYFLKVNLQVCEYGLAVRLADEWEAEQYDCHWYCPYTEIRSIDFRTEKDGTVTMIAAGNAAAWYLRDGVSYALVPPAHQRKLFGGKDKIIINLGDSANDVRKALKAVLPTGSCERS